ncbi:MULTISPECIES: hypothetical protein [unclassified Microcoleus]|uniref:hypothetical protein n=1 Tax=unclassified Microcoleus TaxID=2642155 RepID=UPI002FD00589
MVKRHELIFTMDLAENSDLIYGNLQLIYPRGEAIDYIATSGCANWQRPGDEWMRGKGPIPAGEYEIPSEPYYLETRGVEGDFFHITPDPVVSDKGVRAELGLHFDANYPGSAGCVVIKNQEGWRGFCDRMASIAGEVKFLPLTVRYT